MVKQAHNEVGSMLGFEFPGLVMDTRQAVLDALEQFQERLRSMLADLENHVAKSQSAGNTGAVEKTSRENE